MPIRKPLMIAMITLLAISLGVNSSLAADADFVSSLNLSKEQIQKLGKIVDTVSAEKQALEAKIDNSRVVLAQELRKADRWESEAKNKASAKVVNREIKKLVALGGDLLKLNVKYFLKAKDVFTDEQKIIILSRLKTGSSSSSAAQFRPWMSRLPRWANEL